MYVQSVLYVDVLSCVIWAKMSYGIITKEPNRHLKHPMKESTASSSTRQTNWWIFPVKRIFPFNTGVLKKTPENILLLIKTTNIAF